MITPSRNKVVKGIEISKYSLKARNFESVTLKDQC